MLGDIERRALAEQYLLLLSQQWREKLAQAAAKEYREPDCVWWLR